ncbi:hypothetical protein HDU76_008764 [Blyttiomyces sp. JEL0837]|nr:hypothetical protein HDU76_008764 [Blyttiomyces sp. JEL0837]
MPLRLAMNTQQFPRTFEDRSYVFKIARRPAELQGKTVHNLNVRGKRGNIAQVRNNVEYDFVPHILKAQQGDYVHFQWCGSSYNDNNNQGQGTSGTDRHNIVPLPSFDRNKLQTLANAPSLFDTDTMSRLAWQDQNVSKCFSVNEMVTTQANNQQDPRSCHFLNQAKEYFSHIAQIQTPGVMYYMCTRNNAFTNRSQKGVIISIAAGLSPGVIAGITVGALGGVGAAVAAGLFVYKRQYGSLSRIKYHFTGRV